MTDNDIEGLLTHIGIELGRSTDSEVYGYCPGHKQNLGREDRKPSTWSVSRTTGNHYCFSCEYGGTLPELVLEKKGATSLWGALGLLREFGIDLSDPDDLPKSYHARRRLPPPNFLDEEDVSGFIEPPARALRARSLSLESVEHYGVRYDPHEKAWILPIRLLGGALLGWQEKGSRYFNNHPDGVEKSRTLFGIDVFEPGTWAILVESPLDCLRIYTAGFNGAVSSYGSAVSDDQMRLLMSLTDKVIFALDNDDSGIKSMQRLLTGKWTDSKGRSHEGTAWATKFDAYVLNYKYSSGKDPGEMKSDDEIAWSIENAIPALAWAA